MSTLSQTEGQELTVATVDVLDQHVHHARIPALGEVKHLLVAAAGGEQPAQPPVRTCMGKREAGNGQSHNGSTGMIENRLVSNTGSSPPPRLVPLTLSALPGPVTFRMLTPEPMLTTR